MTQAEVLADWRLNVEKITQTEAAARVGVSQGTWSAWEAGTKAPDLPNAFAVERMSGGRVSAAGWARARRKPRRPRKPLPRGGVV